VNHKKTRLYQFFANIETFKWKIAVKSILAGAVAGLLASVYRLATEKGIDFSVAVYAYLKQHPAMILVYVLAAVAAGLFIAWLIKIEPMASGGGVPQVEGLVLYGMKMKWYLVIAVRYLAGILGSLFGLSFGPEGPSIQIGAAVHQGLSKKMCKTKIEENYLVTAGAAAGLSAAFSAPLTGMIFALEEIHRSFSPSILLSATAASLSADVVSKYFFGLKPVLYFQSMTQMSLDTYLWLLPLGIFIGFSGVLINRGLLLLQTLYSKIKPQARPVIALLFALPCGIFLPQVLGGGRNLITIAEQRTNYALSMIVVIFLVKLAFTCVSFGSGTPGGIFMPIIAISALAGDIFALSAVHLGIPSEYLSIFIVCAMAGGLSACVKAPVTSIILTIELTGSVMHILPVAICSFLALFVSDLFHTSPIYEELLQRYIKKHGYTISTDKRGELMEFPVEYGSEIAAKLLRDIDWPSGSLIVGLRRGSEELIPKGDTKIMPGDYLLILTPENKEKTIKQKLSKLCHTN
jgi:H+/Cl- antiporter ClcA